MEGSTNVLGARAGLQRWEGLRQAARILGSYSRWLFWAVVVSAIPIGISLFNAPSGTSVSEQLSHGDFVVMASAIAGGSMCELLGPEWPATWAWIRNILIPTYFTTIIGSTVLLTSIANDTIDYKDGKLIHVGKLTAHQETRYSFYLLLLAVLSALPAMVPELRTIRRFKPAPEDSEKPHVAPQGGDE